MKTSEVIKFFEEKGHFLGLVMGDNTSKEEDKLNELNEKILEIRKEIKDNLKK